MACFMSKLIEHRPVYYHPDYAKERDKRRKMFTRYDPFNGVLALGYDITKETEEERIERFLDGEEIYYPNDYV